MTTLPITLSATRRLHEKKTIFDYLEDPKSTACLPSLSCVLNELQTVSRKSDVRLEEVVRLVHMDLGMTSRVLRMANSAYYAPSEPIVDVQEAILNMGLSTFRRAVLAANCIELTSEISPDALDWKEFWLHAGGVGHITMELSSRLQKANADSESFYLMGLMHDIGKVVLAYVMPCEFQSIYLQTAWEKKAPAELEMELLKIDHGQLGGWYLEKQGIPALIYEPVRFHHFPGAEDNPHFNHARLIKLSDLLARYFMLGKSGNHSEISDPFVTEEWNWYVENSRHSDADGLRENVIEQVARIADLVRQIIA
jgi:HD-like signal output (HDOD) protein